MDTDLISSIADELIEAAKVYYEAKSEPLLSDAEFDEKQAFLASVVDSIDDPELLTKVQLILEGELNLGAVLEISDEVIHHAPMLSLTKANTEEQLRKFIVKMLDSGAESFKLQLKLDGFALSARYEDGVLQQLATRGTGEVGENSSFLLSADGVTIRGLPRVIDQKGTVELRGELFFTEAQFAAVDAKRVALTGTPFKNSRNAVVGLRLKATRGLDFPVEFSFSAYSAWEGMRPIELSSISAENFDTVEELTLRELNGKAVELSKLSTVEDVLASVAAMEPLIDHFEAPNDGVVVKPTNEAQLLAELGNSSHSPASQIAYKYPTPSVPTEVIGITFSVGKTGKITPRAQLRPVEVMGTLVGSATLNNYDWVANKYSNDVRVGSQIMLTRANKVIPFISAVVHNPEGTSPAEVPRTCPGCGDNLHSEDGTWPPKTLRCLNRDCPSRDIFSILNAVSKASLDIDGMSGATVDYLHEEGKLNSMADLYSLTMEDLADSTFGYSKNGTPRKLGETRAQNILDHIEASKTLPLVRMLTALSIQTLGGRASKSLVAHFGTIEAIRAATVEEIATIDKFGEKKAQLIVDGLAHRSKVIDQMISAGVTFPAAEAAASSGDTLSGLSFAISGPVPAPFPNRGAWVEFIEANGGAFHSGPKAATSYMVADSAGSSSKVLKAQDLGVAFMTAEEFTERFSA